MALVSSHAMFSRLVLILAGILLIPFAAAKEPTEKVLSSEQGLSTRGWAPGESITVECLNRTSETGEHVTLDNGELQYIPFWTCSETGKPLALSFGSEKDINCTINDIDDPLFHILEFYVHNDAPLSCRIPSLPPAAHGGKLGTAVQYTHLQVALTGVLQLSHLHINPQLNVLLHTTEAVLADKVGKEQEEQDRGKKKAKSKGEKGGTGAKEGQIIAAAAYSLPPTKNAPKVVIGDPLPLVFRVRWYSTALLPPSTSRISSGLGGHVHLSTAAYCLLSFGAGLAVSIAYFRGVDMPRRLRRYGAEKLGAGGEGRGGGYGYAYVPGGFPSGPASGKRD